MASTSSDSTAATKPHPASVDIPITILREPEPAARADFLSTNTSPALSRRASGQTMTSDTPYIIATSSPSQGTQSIDHVSSSNKVLGLSVPNNKDGGIGGGLLRTPSVEFLSDHSDDESTTSTTAAKTPNSMASTQISQPLASHSHHVAPQSSDQQFFNRHFPQLAQEHVRGVVSCALERDVLWSGRLMYTRHHLCFHAKLFHKTALICIAWRDVLSMEKRSSAGMFHAIKVMTLHSRYVFTNMSKRDAVFAKLQAIWERTMAPTIALGQVVVAKDEEGAKGRIPDLVSTEPQVQPKQRTSVVLVPNSNENLTLRDLEGTDLALDESIGANSVNAAKLAASVAPADLKPQSSNSTSLDSLLLDQKLEPSGVATPPRVTRFSFRRRAMKQSASQMEIKTDSWGANSDAQELKLPTEPVECGCEGHLKIQVMNQVIEGMDIRQLSALFLDASGHAFLEKIHKNKGIKSYPFGQWDQFEGKRRRNFEYTMPFKAPMMPASTTSCLETQIILRENKFMTVLEIRTKTPNVPYGDAFEILNRICLTYHSPTSTRFQLSMNVEFSRSVMWERQIVKSSQEGVSAHYTTLFDELRKSISGPGFLDRLPNLKEDKPKISVPIEAPPPPVVSSPARSLDKEHGMESMSWTRRAAWGILSLGILLGFLNVILYVVVSWKMATVPVRLGISQHHLAKLLNEDMHFSSIPVSQRVIVSNVHQLERYRWVMHQEEALMDAFMKNPDSDE